MKELENIVMKTADAFEEVTPEIMLDALQPTKDKADLYCPKKTLALVNSGYLEITGTGSRARVEMGYAKGGSPSYAVYVHEIVEYHHEAPTRSKWLQAAMFEDLNQIWANLCSNYRVWLAGI
jgi:hypothetical protein